MYKKAIIIEDTPSDLDFFSQVIQEQSQWKLLGSFGSLYDFWERSLECDDPFYTFLDIDLSGTSSLNYIPKVLELYPNTTIIMYTENEHFEQLHQAIQNGASGYILKTYDAKELSNYLKIIGLGGAIISPIMSRKLIHNIQQKSDEFKQSNRLSDNDLMTLQKIAQGWSYKKIAEDLGMTVEGIRSRIRRLYEKLNVHSKLEAVNKFKEMNY